MKNLDVIIVGAGFTGLAAAYELSKNGYSVKVFDSESEAGGLAGTFEFKDGVILEKFYHHWFNTDKYITDLVSELGVDSEISRLPTNTGMYFNGRIWRLSKPTDLLKFKALSFIDRLRLGFLVFQVRLLKDWKSIEHLNIKEWLVPLCGENVYKVIWEPLIKSKFSIYANSINAVWMWKKLLLRGSTRNKKGNEELVYFNGGFGRLIQLLVLRIKNNKGEISLNTKVVGVTTSNNEIKSIKTNKGEYKAKKYLFTPSLPIISGIFNDCRSNLSWKNSLNKIRYLGNICLILRLKKSLSDTYWLNVNDPGFPFVGVIEHTNLDNEEKVLKSEIHFR